MKSLFPFMLVLVFGLIIGCAPDDPCELVECGPGDCVEGICDCPEGFIGDNCEIALCFGVPCINGDCDPVTESCNCNPSYYGEECDILCKNGVYEDGNCTCEVGYEGAACDIESREIFLGWWGCQEWTWASPPGSTPVQGFVPGSIKFECGSNIPQIELFSTPNSDGLLRLSSDKRIVGLVSRNAINFQAQNITPDITIQGSATLDNDRILTINLLFFNSATSTTELVKGTFTLYRHIKQCS